ncbi:MAG TPA: DUF975 family protein [Clostridiaceae bacterium]|nr:DUF975 family protein [Clostridiaceae bacterium]
MWNRATLKQRAKAALRGRYGSGILIIFLSGLITTVFGAVLWQASVFAAAPTLYSSFADLFRNADLQNADPEAMRLFADQVLEVVRTIGPQMLIVSGIVLVLSFLFYLFVKLILSVGLTRWFLRNSESEYEIPASVLFSPYRSGQFGATVRGMFWRDLWQFIWGLPALLATTWVGGIHYLYGKEIYELQEAQIPNLLDLSFSLVTPIGTLSLAYFHIIGIASVVTLIFGVISLIKMYSYRMVPYILADNPHHGALRTLRLSKRMTRGHKGGMFFLDLSFIGWLILTLICCFGLPFAFWLLVGPYYRATQAELYGAVRTDAVERGLVTMEALGYVRKDAV